jgi:hypothetical protein
MTCAMAAGDGLATPSSVLLMLIARDIERELPLAATKLRWIASDVAWMERRIQELVTDEITAQNLKRETQ